MKALIRRTSVVVFLTVPALLFHFRTALLCVAVRYDARVLARPLLAIGADANAPMDGDAWPLLFALVNDDKALVESLLQHGARPDVSDRTGKTLLCAALTMNRAEIVAPLVTPSTIALEETKNGPFACLGGREDESELAKLLVTRGARVNFVAKNGHTPLMVAAGDYGDPELTKVLLALGADPRTHLMDGSSAISLAVDGCNVEAVRVLLDAGVDGNSFVGGKKLIDRAREGFQESMTISPIAANKFSQIIRMLEGH